MNDDAIETTPVDAPPTVYPDGQFAIVEIMGHVTIVGRVQEVQRFGTSMLAIEPLFAGQLLSPILQGGASIYRYTEVPTSIAFAHQPTRGWQLPGAVRTVVPPALLEQRNVARAPTDIGFCVEDDLGLGEDV